MFPDFRNRKLRDDSARSVSVCLAAAAASRLVSVAVLRWQICIMAVSTSPARLDGLPTLPGVEHHWVDVQTGSGLVRLHLAATGSGPPVLLLHGWPQHWWCWRRVVRQLRDYRLLT
jgi:hypothetical protein